MNVIYRGKNYMMPMWKLAGVVDGKLTHEHYVVGDQKEVEERQREFLKDGVRMGIFSTANLYMYNIYENKSIFVRQIREVA